MSVPYVQNMSEEIKKTVGNNRNLNLTFSNGKNIGNLLRNTKSSDQDQLRNSGIYKVTCECKKMYVGQTGRSIKTRVKEHFSSANLGKHGMSSLSDHLIETNHKPENCGVELVQKCVKGKKMDLLEQLEIEKHRGENLLNTQIESQVAALYIPPTALRKLRHPQSTGR